MLCLSHPATVLFAIPKVTVNVTALSMKKSRLKSRILDLLMIEFALGVAKLAPDVVQWDRMPFRRDFRGCPDPVRCRQLAEIFKTYMLEETVKRELCPGMMKLTT